MKEKIIIVTGDDLSIAVTAAKKFYEIRRDQKKCPDIICMSGKSFLFFKSQAQKTKDILMFFGISESRIQVRNEKTFQECITSSLQNVNVDNIIWCLPPGMGIMLNRIALKMGKELNSSNFCEDWKTILSPNKKARKKEIKTFALQLIANKLVGPGDVIANHWISTRIVFDAMGRPTFAPAIFPYGMQ